jgi:glycosyltransferase involved in cell wall biosynthesis
MKTKENNTISVIILTKNEEAQIEDCLKTCDIFDEILIIDSNSSDNTLDIAKNYTSNIYKRDFTNFKEQREFGVNLAKSEWIFFLDADERLNESLKKTIKEFIAQSEYSFLVTPRKNYLLGHWVANSGWFPDYTGRLVRKNTINFTPKIVHEDIVTTGETLFLEKTTDSFLIHYTCNDLSKYFEKINHYTSLEAEQYFKEDKFKIGRWAIFTRSIGMLTQTFFHFKGYKDGMAGFMVAIFNCIYSFMLMSKIWELQQKNKDE